MALSDGLVGYWSAWLGSSGYRLLDRTVYANHGSLVNMDAGTDWIGATIQGRSGRVLDFDGTNDYIDFSASTGKITNLITVASWFKTTQSGSIGRLCAKPRIAANQQAYSLATNVSANKASFLVNTSGGGTNIITSTTSVNTGDWFFVAGTYDATNIRIFVNGLQEASNTQSGTLLYDNDLPFQIGRFDSLGQYFSGQIGSIGLYNRALNPSEIKTLYNLGPGWYRPYQKRSIGYAAAGFKAYWHRRQSQIIGGGLR